MAVMGLNSCECAKLDDYWKRYGSSNSEGSDAQKSEVESNILIQFRSSVPLCAGPTNIH